MRPSVMDAVETRYAQLRASAQQFPIVEFGLSVFSWDQRVRGFRVETFAFPIFPVAHEPTDPHAQAQYTSEAVPAAAAAAPDAVPAPLQQLPDRRFVLQAKCLQFIRAHGFDLNRWVDEGIGYLSHQEQRELRQELTSTPTGSVKAASVDSEGPDPPSIVSNELQALMEATARQVADAIASFSTSTTTDRVDQRSRRSRHRRRSIASSDEVAAEQAASDQSEVAGEEGGPRDGMDESEDGDPGGGGEADARAGMREVRIMKRFLHTPLSSTPPPTNLPCPAVVTEPLAPFRRHAVLHHVQTQFPDAAMYDCPADNDESSDQGEANGNGNGNGNGNATPWRRRVRIVMPTSAKQQAALALAASQIEDTAQRERNAKLVGFTSVLDLVVSARKPIVGHNMLLDMLQCFDKFHGPLPARCAAFQAQLFDWLCNGKGVDDESASASSFLPPPALHINVSAHVGVGGLFDTKEMVAAAMQSVDACAALVQPHSALEHCYSVLSDAPFVGPRVFIDSDERTRHHYNHHNRAARRGDGSSSPPPPPPPLSPPLAHSSSPSSPRVMAHQAGYDAFMTGCVFLRVCATLGVPNAAVAALGDAYAFAKLPPGSRATLEGFRNALHLSHLLPATRLTLPGPFPRDATTPSRGRFLRVKLTRTYAPSPRSSAPGAALKSFHIKQCLAWTLDVPANRVAVHWEGAKCVYVALPTREAADMLLKVRAETQEATGSAKDPMPSIGCVDLERCGGASSEEEDGDKDGATACGKRPWLEEDEDDHHGSSSRLWT
jgi:hypothetical protein